MHASFLHTHPAGAPAAVARFVAAARAAVPARMTGYAVGIGARPGVRTAAVRALLERVLAEHGLDPAAAVFATVAARADEPGLREALGPDRRDALWRADELAAEPVPHPSGRVAAAVGTPSVAEAAALRTARTFPGAAGAELVVTKTAGDGVTRRRPADSRREVAAADAVAAARALR